MAGLMHHCMDSVCALFPPEIGNLIARYVHALNFAEVQRDLNTRVVRICVENGSFYICNNDNYYASLAVIDL